MFKLKSKNSTNINSVNSPMGLVYAFKIETGQQLFLEYKFV